MASFTLTTLGLAASWLLAAIPSTTAQFVPAPTDLNSTTGHLNLPVRYKEVPPGICETTPGVKSYTGYVTVAPQQHLFFWFFEARDVDPTTAPLSAWINGGPGTSSLLGLFQENGPCGVDFEGNLYNNPFSYNTVSNMIYIDQPTQVGLSYSEAVPAFLGYSGDDVVVLQEEKCPEYGEQCGTYSLPYITDTVNSTVNGAPSFWKALQGFMGAFPQYSRNGFHMNTESYGGHYAPIYMEYFEEQNALIANGSLPNAIPISLETVMIGNGWYDPLIQYGAYYNWTVLNTYDISISAANHERMYNSMYGAGNCRDRILMCASTGRSDVCSAADSFCQDEVEELYDETLGRDEYDSRELKPSRFPYPFFADYLNTPRVQRAIGAFTNYTESVAVDSAFADTGDDNREEGTVAACRDLVDRGVYMVQYDGDADYNCNWFGTQVIAGMIDSPGFNDEATGFMNLSTSDDIVHGQVKQADNFAFVRVYESGHEVPFYQPLAALTMFNRTIHGLDVATGKVKVMKGGDFKTTGPKESTYREGGATVVHHTLPADATYNTTTNRPNPIPKKGKKKGGKKGKPPGEKRDVGSSDTDVVATRRLKRRKAKPPMKLLLAKRP